MLRLLGTDLDGPDIARELIVSLNTVRTHTKNIYAKLGVNNRRAAVRRAEELDLLSRTRGTADPGSPLQCAAHVARTSAHVVGTNHHAQSPHVVMRAHHISLLPFDQANEHPQRRLSPGSDSERSTMSETSTGHHHDAGRYEIRLKGHLDSRWAAWFDGLSLTNEQRRHHRHLWPGRSTRPPCMACSRKCATSACRWSRSLRSTPTSPTYPPSHPDSCSPQSTARRTT